MSARIPSEQTHDSPVPDGDCSGSMDAFHRRGEAAWQAYLRTSRSVPVEEVFASIQAVFDSKRAALAAQATSR